MKYTHQETIARSRIPVILMTGLLSLALLLGAAIWTSDADFLGCGLPTWTTDTLLVHLSSAEVSHLRRCVHVACFPKGSVAFTKCSEAFSV